MEKKTKDINEIAFNIVEQATGGEVKKPDAPKSYGGSIRVAASIGDKKKKHSPKDNRPK